MKRFLLVIVVALVGIILFYALSSVSRKKFDIEPLDNTFINFQLETELLQKPSPLQMDGKIYLTYEIFMSNMGHTPFKLDRVEIVDAAHPNNVLFTYDDKQLPYMISSYEHTISGEKETLVLKPGAREILFFMPPFKQLRDIPKRLIHRFIMQSDQQDQKIVSTTVAPVETQMTSPLIVSAPLQGEYWLAVNGPSNTSIHRRAYDINHGVVNFPERFAIDFMQFGSNGKPYKEDASVNKNYFGYGATVYAVSAGVVVAVHDGEPDNKPGRRDYPINLNNLGGNSVLIDMGQHRYAFYGHLMPNSLKVKVGDRVSNGQPIGLLGNSGNSDAPHLHFHIVNSPSELFAQGIPYGFELFYTVTIQMPNPDEPTVIYGTDRQVHKNELVPENSMMIFEEK